MKRFKQYAFLSLAIGLVLALTPSQSFASLYLTVGHRTNPADITDSAQLGNVNIADNSGQLGSGNIFDEITDYLANFL